MFSGSKSNLANTFGTAFQARPVTRPSREPWFGAGPGTRPDISWPEQIWQSGWVIDRGNLLDLIRPGSWRCSPAHATSQRRVGDREFLIYTNQFSAQVHIMCRSSNDSGCASQVREAEAHRPHEYVYSAVLRHWGPPDEPPAWSSGQRDSLAIG
jgi:hypothetical protein